MKEGRGRWNRGFRKGVREIHKSVLTTSKCQKGLGRKRAHLAWKEGSLGRLHGSRGTYTGPQSMGRTITASNEGRAFRGGRTQPRSFRVHPRGRWWSAVALWQGQKGEVGTKNRSRDQKQQQALTSWSWPAPQGNEEGGNSKVTFSENSHESHSLDGLGGKPHMVTNYICFLNVLTLGAESIFFIFI